MSRITRVFLAGLLALLPLILTVAVTGWVVSILNDYVGPTSSFGRILVSLGIGVGAQSFAPYVIGLLALLVAIYVLGLLFESRIGDMVSDVMDRAVTRIPVIGSVYDLSKRFTSIVDTKNGGDLKSMTPVWCFFGGEPGAAVLALLPSPKPVAIGAHEYVGILIPSAPVPVGGALIYVPKSWLRPAEGGVDELMSVYVSMGVTPPTPVPSGARLT
ncbi:MAG: hypothetical protein B7Y80_07040 [Hyphomicrobium sp. 32-62-53]|nr:MAG: hypothetical protein B7Z29_04485 [Hyphomicrobium sp. 12-62-95]OYY00371.1 MAG: hypothetical protein B7Y80_07040 [Hyphomicrobium sp. 32-62-53]